MEQTSEQITGYAINRTADAIKRAEETRTITFIASTSTIDRHGSVLNMDGWSLENFRKNPIIGYQHNVYGDGMCLAPDPDDIIGKGLNVRMAEGKLLLDLVFEKGSNNPKAEKIFRKVQSGFLNAVSVGFSAIENENGDQHRKGIEANGENPDVDYFFGQELFEVSVVNLPSNPDAVKKSLRSQTENALIFIQRATGKKFSEIEGMKVIDVLNAVEGNTDNLTKKFTKDAENVSITEDVVIEYLEKKYKEISSDELKEADSKESDVASNRGGLDLVEIERMLQLKSKKNEV